MKFAILTADSEKDCDLGIGPGGVWTLVTCELRLLMKDTKSIGIYVLEADA